MVEKRTDAQRAAYVSPFPVGEKTKRLMAAYSHKGMPAASGIPGTNSQPKFNLERIPKTFPINAQDAVFSALIGILSNSHLDLVIDREFIIDEAIIYAIIAIEKMDNLRGAA